ncbi:signal protein [Sphingomonas sp. Leaf412]|uniref:TonB-dependent receptor n=1 Tax=Sphingomonas sp. Leaf412 TaxID=1736370 RepID=UPI0006FECD90|nr:TonB-dependent receptor [Sphingomonas sp. Leaf412]KQT34752.1 signal protein [Sphingomonas sp. Leaf412]
MDATHHIHFAGTRSRLATQASVLALVLAATPAWAQETPDPNAPSANPTGKITVTQPVPAADPTPDAQANPDATATPAEEEGEIVVTGIRASLARSAEIKRNSTLIVDSVSAEDIGKLPDVSIADSLARLPGVTAQRVEGRDQNLSIRGLGPDFSTTLFNGREQVTVGDNRGVEYDQYPSEFFRNVNVYKSPDASLIAAGISGTVDLRSMRPLEQRDRSIVVSARGQYNGIGKRNPDGERLGYRVSGAFVDKFADDTFGVAIGFAATEAPTNYDKYEAWGYPGSGTTADPYNLGGAKPYVQSNLLKRYGGVATLEWQPSDRFHSTFDALYTHFNEVQRLRGIEFPLGFNVPATNVVARDGFVQSATFNPLYTVQRNDYQEREADLFSFGWNNDFLIGDTTHFNVDASWSRAERTDFLLETYSGTGYNGAGVRDTINITRQDNGTYKIVPTLNYADTGIIRITDPGGWGFNGTSAVVQAGFVNQPKFTDDLKSLRASLQGEFGDLGVIKGWEVGGNYSQREKASTYTSNFLCPKGGGTNCTVASGTPTSIAVPADAVLKENASLGFLGVPQMLTVDPLKIFGLLNPVFDNRPESLAKAYSVTEKVWTGYAKLVIDGEAGGKNLKGSLGVQVVHTDQSSDGRIAGLVAGAVTLADVTGGVKYTNFLPSATMSVELLPSTFVKLGASRTMVRPRIDQERISQNVSINPANVGRGSAPQDSPFSSNGGNFALLPYKSTNIDLSLEKYFPAGGYVALTGYFKSISDYVDENNNVLYDFSSLLSSLTPAQQATVRAQNAQFGLFRNPANSGDGELIGAEATASLPFRTITTALDGFGVFASGSYTYSAIRLDSNPGQNITLPGLSDWVLNGTAYFEKSGFQARATYRYRSKFLAEVRGLSATPELNTARGEGILDAQIGYEFQSGPLQGLAILAQAKNLTDQEFVQYTNGDERQVRRYQRYGTDYYLGLTYRF